MKKRKSVSVLLSLLVGLGFLLASRLAAQEKTEAPKKFFPEGTASEWMKKKLELSQNIVAGLTQADFDKIRGNANSLAFLGFLEKWTLAERPEYKRQLVLYEFSTLELGRQAKGKNLEGATLAYNQLTVSCVQCHKIVRDAKR